MVEAGLAGPPGPVVAEPVMADLELGLGLVWVEIPAKGAISKDSNVTLEAVQVWMGTINLGRSHSMFCSNCVLFLSD